MTSVDDCITCPAGSFCPVGSENATLCAPGTVNADSGADKCSPCAAGTFQANSGNVSCEACSPGYYCTEGSAAPLPCPGGYAVRSESLGVVIERAVHRLPSGYILRRRLCGGDGLRTGFLRRYCGKRDVRPVRGGYIPGRGGPDFLQGLFGRGLLSHGRLQHPRSLVRAIKPTRPTLCVPVSGVGGVANAVSYC